VAGVQDIVKVGCERFWQTEFIHERFWRTDDYERPSLFVGRDVRQIFSSRKYDFLFHYLFTFTPN
jgi:hypothetical protein